MCVCVPLSVLSSLIVLMVGHRHRNKEKFVFYECFVVVHFGDDPPPPTPPPTSTPSPPAQQQNSCSAQVSTAHDFSNETDLTEKLPDTVIVET